MCLEQVTWRLLPLVSQKEESVWKQENPHVATGAKAGLPGPGGQVLVCPVSVSSAFLGVVGQS